MAEEDQDENERIWVALATEGDHRIRTLLARFWNNLLVFYKFVFTLLGIVLGTMLLYEVGREIFFRNAVQLDSFSVPQSFADAGYTSEAIDNRVLDEILRIGSASHAQLGDGFVVLKAADLSDIEVPSTKFSVRATVQLTQEILRLQPPRFGGEIAIVQPTPGAASREPRLSITIRRIYHGTRTSESIDVTPATPESAITLLAQEVLRQVHPDVLAVYALQQGNAKGAIELCKEVLAQKPNYALAYNVWGVALDKYEHDPDGAIQKFQRATELDPQMATAYSNWGMVLAQSKHDPNGAIAKFKRAIDLDPRLPDPYSGWGSVLVDYYRDADGAIAKFQKALEINPTYAAAYSNWGGALVDLKHDPDAAIIKYQRAIQLDPNFANAYDGWGNALVAKHDPDGAITKFQKAIALDPKLALAYNGWGNALYDKHDPDGAIAKFQEAIRLDPRYALPFNGWGNTLALYKHDFDGAIEKYKRATELQPNLAVIYFNWGNTLANKGDLVGAMKKFEKVLELDPTNQAARQNLELLKQYLSGQQGTAPSNQNQ